MRVLSKQELLDFTNAYKEMLVECSEYRLRAYHHHNEVIRLKKELMRIVSLEADVKELRGMIESILEKYK